MSDENEIQRIFLIAGLSGYTAPTEAHGSISAARIVKRYIEIVQECLHEDSQLVETIGDEVIIVGNDAANLIRAGLNLSLNEIEGRCEKIIQVVSTFFAAVFFSRQQNFLVNPTA